MPDSPVQVRSSTGKGRSLHATRAFSAGEVISSFTPLLLLPSLSSLTSVCTYCLRPGDPRACTRCRAAFYCGAACQAADWSAVHSAECKPLQRAAPRQLPTPVRALIRVLVKDRVAEGLGALEGHVAQRRSRPGWSDLQMMAMGACGFSGKGTDEAQLQRAVDLLCKIQTNAFHRYDVDLGQVGIFLEPTLAMANHSCLPNAFVQFIGRRAILRAETPIQAGDEIQISYTDYTAPLRKRKEALSDYIFECQCLRCAKDLNVYQACAVSSHLTSNHLSVVPDLAAVKAHAAVVDSAKAAEARKVMDSLAGMTESQSLSEPPAQRLKELQAQYAACRWLVDAELWACSPLPQMLTEVSIAYAEEGNYAFALTIACHVAVACDTFRYAAPFHPVRVKGLLMITKLLANTAADTAALSAALRHHGTKGNLQQSTQDALQDVDQVSLCEMLLEMVLRCAPASHAAEWELSAAARDMLGDIKQLPGRERELSLIDTWRRDPLGDQSQAFFEFAVVKQVDALAKLGRAILRSEFER